MRVLVVEDDEMIAEGLRFSLMSEDYEVLSAGTVQEAEKIWRSGMRPDFCLLDVMLPDGDGFSLCREIRRSSKVPVLFLTACDDEVSTVRALELGADDYITKPFNPLEVIARVKSQLRRYTSLGGSEKSTGLITVGPVSMDDSAKRVTVDGEPVALTPIEYNILKLLISHPGQVFSSAQIYEQVWNDPAYGSENTVAVHIRHLREKIEIDPADPRWLKVVWGLGYKMEKGGA